VVHHSTSMRKSGRVIKINYVQKRKKERVGRARQTNLPAKFTSKLSDKERTRRQSKHSTHPQRKRKRKMASDIGCCSSKFMLYMVIIIGLVTFAGLMAGLTLGLMSLGLVDLEVLIKSGRPQDRIHAGTLTIPV